MANKTSRTTEEKYRVLLDINNAIITHHDRDAVFDEVTAALGSLVPFDRVNIMLYVAETDGFRPYTRSGPSVIPEHFRQRVLPREGSLLGYVIDEQRPVIQRFDRDDEENPLRPLEAPIVQEAFRKEGFKVSILIPMVTPRGPVGTLNLASKSADQYSDSDGAFLMEVAGQVAIAVENMLAYEEIARLKERLEEENTYLIQEIETGHSFEDLVGQSPTFRQVLQSVETVADTDAGVLVLGETGTGKELVARAVHHLSRRKEKILVRVNCASLPANLIESEMFGHERGAFTGATGRKIGRFEVADGGSLFLDEIGELPLELQSK
ncbi:MAG: sigma 54-interacting transcriptional regulator, partial [Candidatus Latescibacteria bacterium]|nr:sigma 54-interacting transcriptional regulator [Candidatus Latescibacterota bacterium]